MSITLTRGVPPRSRKAVRATPPVLDPPTGLRCPRKMLGQRQGLVRTYCGPWAVMAITGRPYEEVKAAFNDHRNRDVGHTLRGTSYSEVRRILRSYGWDSEHVPNIMLREWSVQDRKPVSFAAALRGRTSEQMKEVWLVAAANHWILVQGRKVTCSLLQQWTWIKHAKKRRGHVEAIFKVWKRPDASQIAEQAKAKNKTLVAAKDRARRASARRSVTQSYYRKKVLVEFKRLDCTHEVNGRGEDFEVKVWAPDGWFFDPEGGGRFYASWQEAYEDLTGKTPDELFARDPAYDDE